MEEQNYLGCEWNNKRLGDILEIMTGGTPSKNNDEYWSDGNIPWMVSGDINKGIINEVDGKITELGMNNSAAKLLPKDTVMIALNGQGKTKGKVAYLNIEVTCNQSLAGFLPNQEFNSKFLYYNLQNRYTEIRNLTGDGARNGLNLSILRDIYVLFPPLKQQKKIAEILSTVDSQIDDTDKIIEKTKELKKGLMQRLLTKGIGHSEFKKSEVGEIPVEWDIVDLSEICDINPKKRLLEMDDDVSFVSMEHVSNDGKLLSYSIKKYKDVYKGYTAFENDDVLLAKITPCFENGKKAIVEDLVNGIGFGSTEFHVLRAKNKKSISKFIYYFVSTHRFREQAQLNMTGSAGQKRVPTNFLKDIKVMLPSLEEQIKITNILLSVDNQIEEYKNKKIKLEELKKGLMQQLLTGKIRVI